MSASKDRIEVKIDILEIPAQRALVLPTLLPDELIGAVLQEFREVERLGVDMNAYELIDVATGKPLENQPIGVQRSQGAGEIHLKLAERVPVAPKGSQLANESIYLREPTSGRVFKLNWLPAIIGRPDRNLPDNQLLAANLESMSSGLRVSRRHAQISCQGTDYFVQRLSGNPASLRRATGEIVHLFDSSRVPILNGDVLYLERSQIALKFLVWRPEQPTEQPDNTNPPDEEEGKAHGE